MGASLGCCIGPSDDFDMAMAKRSRYHPMMGRCDAVEKSLLQKLQRSLSSSWAARGSPHGASLVGSRYRLDYASESDTEEPSGVDSNASATSGSRLLCDFYNLVLECDHSKFFVDSNGLRVKGAYLNQVDILDDYFDPTRRTTVGSRRRRRSSVDELALLQYQPPHKLKNLGSAYDRASNMSLMSNDTTQTMVSESDYWATFMDAADETFGYGTPPLSHRESTERRRSWMVHDMAMYGSSLGDAVSSLLLFSPVNTESSRPHSSFTSPKNKPQPTTTAATATLIEGSHSNLWGLEDKDKTTHVPPVFTSTAVAEQRRASLTMAAGASAFAQNGATRPSSLHTIAPVAAS